MIKAVVERHNDVGVYGHFTYETGEGEVKSFGGFFAQECPTGYFFGPSSFYDLRGAPESEVDQEKVRTGRVSDLVQKIIPPAVDEYWKKQCGVK